MQYFVLSKKRTLPELIRLVQTAKCLHPPFPLPPAISNPFLSAVAVTVVVGHCLVIFFKRFFRAAQEINLIPRDSVQRFFHSINIVR